MAKQFQLYRAILLTVLLLPLAAAAQTGGTYTITQSVIAGGGQTSTGGTFTLDGTTGQPLAGGLISNPPFDVFSGFWTPELFLQSGTVSGKVIYANALTTTAVPFTTLNAVGSLPLSILTDSNGDYSLSGFASGAYTVTPSKTNQVNGISNLDASRIAQHIVGLTTLTANQQIAADTSGNGAISSLDASYIAQFIASIPNPGITGTWKFLPASRSYPNVQSNQTNQDFSAILVGEVTGNWNPGGQLRPELSMAESRQKRREEKTEQLLVAFTGKQSPAEQFRPDSAEQNEPRKLKAEQIGGVTVTAPLLQPVSPGANFTVDLMVSDTTGEGILGYEFDLIYNQSVLLPQATPCDVSGTISSGRTAVCNANTPGLLRVVVFGATPLSGSGILLKLNFTAVGMAGNVSQLNFQHFMFNEGMPTAITVMAR